MDEAQPTSVEDLRPVAVGPEPGAGRRHRRWRRDAAAAALVAAVAFLTHAGLTAVGGVPRPSVHDEYSYLLGAETFAHGRLTNPPIRHLAHFVAAHVLLTPTYMSKYPPGQALFLAAGKRLAGEYAVGSWMMSALASGAICWMLAGWLRTREAVLGGLLSVVHPATLRWTQSYFGGSLAMLGGALVLGGWIRLMARPRAGSALVMGLGVAVLGLSRPFEGVVLSGLCLGSLIVVAARRRAWRRPADRLLTAAAMAPPVLLAGAFLAVYNTAVTGRPERLPYTVYESQNYSVPLFLFLPLKSEHPPLETDTSRRWNEAGIVAFRECKEHLFRTYAGFVYNHISECFPLLAWARYQTLPLLALIKRTPIIILQLPLIVTPWLVFSGWWRGRLRLVLLLMAGFIALISWTTWSLLHYAAPIFPLVYLLTVLSTRALGRWRWGDWRVGRGIVAATLLVYFIAFPVLSGVLKAGKPGEFPVDRARIAARLAASGEKHIIFVKYSPDHELLEEWVYNGAEPANDPVIWVHDLGPARNRELLEDFKGRRLWRLEPDVLPREVVPYPENG